MVPDSDDEGWDSEDSLQPLSTSHPLPISQPNLRSDDVWEFPGSPASHPTARLTPQITQSPHAQSQSSVSADFGRDVEQLADEQKPASLTLRDFQDESDAPKQDCNSPNNLINVSAGAEAKTEADAYSTLPDRKVEASPSIVQTTASSADPSPDRSLDAIGQEPYFTESHEEENKPHSVASVNTNAVGVPSPAASETPAQGRRSLRPRKPIQEHPYLLENAKYSQAFKSHGLKPVRIAVAEQMSAKRRMDDSQDQEFTDDESQPGETFEESQRPLKKAAGRSLDDDIDELALSQSPRTSSPQRHLRASSEQSPGQQTDDTSIHDDEDFPDIRDVTASTDVFNSLKRRAHPQSSTSRKRLRTKHAVPGHESLRQKQNDAWHLSLSPEPVPLETRRNPTASPTKTSRPSFRLRAISRSVSPTGQLSQASRSVTLAEPIDLTALTGASEEEPDVQETNVSSSDSDSDLIRRTGRRIRGVLPASWLRLDQQTRKEKINTTVRKPSPTLSPDQPRPGLATKRSGFLRPNVSTKSFLEDLDEGDDGTQEPLRTNEQAARYLEEEQFLDGAGNFTLDDNMSVVEDDLVDWMLPGQKRNRASSAGLPRKRKKIQQEALKGSRRYRQPKISGSIYRLNRPSNSAPRSQSKETSHRQAKSVISPLALSIVDVVEPGAPRFIKVAARAATKRNNMGRSKPSNKSINLGNRADNVDAFSVLKRWRTGKIKLSRPEMTQPATQGNPSRSREPLRPVASNTGRLCQPSTGLSFTQPQKLSRKISMENLIITGEAGVCSERQSVRKTRPRRIKSQPPNYDFGHRPAQLEADVLQGDNDNTVFGVRKKILDLVFRKGRKEVLASTFHLRESSPEERSSQGETSRLEPPEALPRLESIPPQLDQHGDSITTKGRRSRKLVPPRRLDLDAPQFKYANDPLPFFDEHPRSVEEVQPQCQEASKIIGLGPFGTHYTQHFDMFPLHGDTFFHRTTIIGDGTLKKALYCRVSRSVTRAQPAFAFEFSNHHFQWGAWTDTTSSELGLLFDLIAEHVEMSGDTDASLDAHRVVDAAGNIINYVLEFVSINEESELRSFTQRMLELLVGFMNHALDSRLGQSSGYVLLQINSRFLICALVLLRFCQGTVGLFDHAQQAEDILSRLAKVVIEELLSIGLSKVRTSYDDLQRLGVREHGIRANNVTLTSWVIIVKVLGSAQIPKAGFWDLVSCAMTATLTHIIDAQRLESLWRDMFTLLPLTEFDDAGVVSREMRYTVPLQGWSLPQKLLKVVFESYQASQRQSPSFNDYCRALLGRCHYLIEQWGWHKCIGIVGTIFDFFGCQSLSHLRNEEVYRSPRFLEELSNKPCLSVEPEDRCFHIFLKILAVAIQGMKRRGLSNDIRNLITRCLPNHNRQYLKEQTIHSHDLASLRNHHDLLCTLFWAAPPEFRRPVALIEDLVRPGSSHKEACLINLRAWSQLTRFVVSSGSSVQDYRPFMSWQNNVFHQVLNQYLSAAADVEHEFMSMAKEDRNKVQKQFRDSIVAANQNAAKDVLYFSVIASLDVTKECPSLTAATFSFNVSQMTKALNNLITKGTDLDWGILQASFDTVDVFVSRLEDLWRGLRESTSDSVSTHSNREFEDAVEFLDDKLVQSFTSAARKVMLSLACDDAAQPACLVIEKAIILCGRIASLFIDGGKTSLLHFFSAGKYGLFEALPDELGLAEWKFVPLFVATLVRNHVFSFASIGCTHFDIWISSLVKPVRALRYEIDLAEALNELNMGYMKGTGTMTRTLLGYSKNRDLFAGGISYMRAEIRQADFAQRRPTKAKYERILKSVMRQIKLAIRSLKPDSTEHSNYISFIRSVVGLIKSHGADICSVDPYFYQVSAEYSPPKEDPQLHTAGILAYGIRLGEGETTAIPQLFSYLYNHFKTSLARDELDAESKIIENGMKDDNVLAFVVGRMLPAIIQASSRSNDIWPLLGVYVKALQNGLTRSCLPREIPDDAVNDVVVLLTAVLNWTQDLRENCTKLTPTQAHIFTELLGICNAIRPSVTCWLLQSSATTSRIWRSLSELTHVAKHAAAVLCELRVSAASEIAVRNVSIQDLILARNQFAPIAFDSHVNIFTQTLIREVQSNWVVTSDLVTVRVAATPSTQRGTQAAQGIKNDLHFTVGLFSELHGGLEDWVSEMNEEVNSQRRRRRGPRHIPRTLAVEF